MKNPNPLSLAAQLKEQDSKIQKVSAQLAAASPSRRMAGGIEMSKVAANVAPNNQ